MRYRLFLAALVMCVPSLSRPQAEASPPEPTSMRFEWMREGPAHVCGNQCREWVAATGPITGDTPRDFQMFAQARDLQGATLVLDSGGGSVLASLELGRKVRHYKMRTTVGRSIKMETASGTEQHAKLSARGECASMCVFVLLGGVQRSVPPQARVLVHQIWPGSKRNDATAETYSAEEMVRIQRDVGRIARYTVDMGGDIELFELAMRIPPWERLRSLTPSELRRMRLQTIDAVAEAATSGAVSPGRLAAKHAANKGAERGWTLNEGTPHRSVHRRHTLTVEGEPIGEFELSLACGDRVGSYKLAYADSRMIISNAVAERLEDVTLRLGGERVSLEIQASNVDSANTELRSVASGVIPAALVERLRKDPTSVIVVGTKTNDDVNTSIRVGATGFAKAFSSFAADCTK